MANNGWRVRDDFRHVLRPYLWIMCHTRLLCFLVPLAKLCPAWVHVAWQHCRWPSEIIGSSWHVLADPCGCYCCTQLQLSCSSLDVDTMATLCDVTVDNSGKRLLVTWSEADDPACFHFVWLRDSCQCPDCFHPVSKGRLLLLRDVDPDVAPTSVKVELQ